MGTKKKVRTENTERLQTTVSPMTMEHIEYIKRSEGFRHISEVITTLALREYNGLVERNQNRLLAKEIK